MYLKGISPEDRDAATTLGILFLVDSTAVMKYTRNIDFSPEDCRGIPAKTQPRDDFRL